MPKKLNAELSWDPQNDPSMGDAHLVLKLGSLSIGRFYPNKDSPVQNYRTILQQMANDYNATIVVD